MIVVILGPKMICIITKIRGFGLARSGPGDAGFEVAVYLMIRHKSPDQRLCLFAHLPKRAGRFEPHNLFKTNLIQPLPAAQLTTVAPGGAKSYTLRFEQDDLASGLSQMQGSRETRVAGTNDADICGLISIQRRKGVQRLYSGCVPALRIRTAFIVGVEQVHGKSSALQTLSNRCSRPQGEMTCRNSSYSARFTME